ncbi:hypothetical protein [Pseudoalteromonas sp. S4741]|uniref:hypothetical protein n=1 Tax=Pseudoalteromonas sp. S4741 TaxID=579563 RepID=UPI00110C171D|nr:hypothetical protein [Pseudoalteromonas sp. S4741]TMO23978.1 hypothetical protein CWC30_08005 [Pseudoalteromonas sp. S4741]
MTTQVNATQVTQLLSLVKEQTSEGNADDALLSLNDLNSLIQQWCEGKGSNKPTRDELASIQVEIKNALSTAMRVKSETAEALLKKKQSSKAISKYKPL